MLRTAWRFMMYDKPKSIGAILGVIVAIFLIGQQSGIFVFLTGTMSGLVDHSGVNVWVVDHSVTDVNRLSDLDVRIGNELHSIEGVKNVYPLIVTGSELKTESGNTSPVVLIGSEPPSFVGGPWNIEKGSGKTLMQEGSVSADKFDIKSLKGLKFGDELEIGGKLVQLNMLTNGARGFGSNYVFTTLALARYLGKFPPNKVSAYLVNVTHPDSVGAVVHRINRTITGVRAWPSKAFSSSTVGSILSSSGIGASIGTLILFAVISGIVIIGLTLYSSAIDRLKDYATMKAIGAKNGYITKLIVIQALIIATIGFLIGGVLMEGFRQGIQNAGVRYHYTLLEWVVFFIITLIISLSGSLFASRRIRKVEPARIFRA
ncbi:MAG TPA: FtsX-like permease family protein [Balneolales bacterium]|nr:FtsX-like permease family protein [Balneolales bacterium]